MGPASSSDEMLAKLLVVGMDAVRINTAHGEYEQYDNLIRRVRKKAHEANKICPIIVDIKGPEIRLHAVKNGEMDLIQDESVTISYENNPEVVCEKNHLLTNYPFMGKSVHRGDVVLIDDGRLALTVTGVDSPSKVQCKVISGGKLKSNKGVNLPGCYVNLPHVTEKDKRDVEFAVSRQVEYIAHSFTRNKDGIDQVRSLPGVRETGMHIIAKIESQEGLDNFSEILDASDGIMVARGDLGVEIPLERVCSMQKRIIRDCNVRGKFVITATEMLDSMIHNARPTRAEASDVANAVFDGTDCVMLSGETAVGKYPIEAVQVMQRICKEAELDITEHHTDNKIEQAIATIFPKGKMEASSYDNIMASQFREVGNLLPAEMSVADEHREAFAKAAVGTARATGAAMIIVFCKFPINARFVAKHRPDVPVFAVSTSSKICAQVSLYNGITAVLVPSLEHKEAVSYALEAASKNHIIRPGSPVMLLKSGADDLNVIETILVDSNGRYGGGDDSGTEGEIKRRKALEYTPGASIAVP